MPARRAVRLLPPEVFRKIAAGEVIDRPAAIVRELMDNAVDSGARSIVVEIDGGGIDRIRVSDDGSGMSKDDLACCARPHATSKISSEKDLLSLSTLGFRGEALASMAAVCRLSITTADSQSEQGEAWRLSPALTGEHNISPAQLACGTAVQTEALFENFPARRQFLKRPASELALCRQMFCEKAIPRPDIAFRLIADGRQKLSLSAGQSLCERFVCASGLSEDVRLFSEIKISDPECADQWTARLVIGEISVHRTDRRQISVYVNGRRINEFSLVQAIEYGSQGYFPNGTHPVAALFVDMRSDLVDFNIHPAKREARFRDLGAVHRAVSRAVREFFRSHTISRLAEEAAGYGENELHEEAPYGFFERGSPSLLYGQFVGAQDREKKEGFLFQDLAAEGSVSDHSPSNHAAAHHFSSARSASERTAGERAASDSFSTQRTSASERFASDSFSTQRMPASDSFSTQRQPPASSLDLPDDFPVHEKSPVSQRAQHSSESTADFIYHGTALGVFLLVEKESKLYFIDQHAAHERILFDAFLACSGRSQRLLVPYVIETSCEADDEYLRALIEPLDRAGFSVQECGGGRWEFEAVPAQWHGSEEDLREDLLSKRIEPKDLMYALAGTTACRAAVKDGNMLDEHTACALARDTFALPDPHCPHGRPLWTVVSREELFKLVRRRE